MNPTVVITPPTPSAAGVPHRPAQHIIALAVLALGYFAAARLGLLLASVHGSVSPVWPATGVAIGGLLLGGFRLWPGVLVGAAVANLLTPVPALTVAGIAIGNTLEALAGAWVARGLPVLWRRFDSDEMGELAGFAVAAALAPVVSASVGVASLTLSGSVAGPVGPTLWWTWWVGDAIGALLIAPLLVALGDPRQRGSCTGGAMVRALVVFGLAAGVCWLVFFRREGAPLLFAVFPVLLLAVAWLGSCGVKITAVLMSTLSLVAAFFDSGPFTEGSLNENLLHLQLFLASVAIAALLLPGFRAAGNLLLPGGVLLAAWTLSGWLFAALHDDRQRATAARLDARIAAAEHSIRERLTTYADGLHGAGALLTARESVGRAEWRAYVDALRLGQRYPGVDGIAAIFPVARAEADAFVQRMRAEGARDFAIQPIAGQGAKEPHPGEHFVVTYIEPHAPNAAAVGRDLATETNRRTAAERARDLGQPQISAPINLLQDAQTRPGFILCLPVFRRGAPVGTVDERRAALIAWVTAPFVTTRFLAAAFSELTGELRLQAFAGAEPTPAALVYSSDPRASSRAFDRVTRLELMGQTLTCGWNRGAGFVATGVSEVVWAATSSALLSLLVAGLVLNMYKVGQRAQAIAEARTRELAASEAQLRRLTDDLRVRNAELARLHQLELDERISAQLGEERARLEMLRYQINPHFLFNSLASVRSQIAGDNVTARENIERLANFCRLTLHRGLSELDAPLRHEVALLRLYLELEQTRLSELLTVSFAIDPAVEDHVIPRMLLLPLVENAIKFGHATNPDSLHVRIAARRTGEALVIEVANTGHWLAHSAPGVPSLGIGHENVRERLQRLYPGAHDLVVAEREGWVILTLRLSGAPRSNGVAV